MADILMETGLGVKRTDTKQGANGRLMRMRGALTRQGDIVQVDLAASDADTDATPIGAKDLGTADGATNGSNLASVVQAGAGVEGQIVGVALAAVADNDELRVEFGDPEFGTITKARSAGAFAVGAELVTAANGELQSGGVGKIVAIALEAASGADELVTVLFQGTHGFGFRQT